jgi:hypothetical protein
MAVCDLISVINLAISCIQLQQEPSDVSHEVGGWLPLRGDTAHASWARAVFDNTPVNPVDFGL